VSRAQWAQIQYILKTVNLKTQNTYGNDASSNGVMVTVNQGGNTDCQLAHLTPISPLL